MKDTILIVDDEKEIADLLELYTVRLGAIRREILLHHNRLPGTECVRPGPIPNRKRAHTRFWRMRRNVRMKTQAIAYSTMRV